jgi:hypothetical protein
MVRRSITSALIPSSASISDACRATCTIEDVATIVMSDPQMFRVTATVNWWASHTARVPPTIRNISNLILFALSADPTQQRGADQVSGSIRVVAVELAIDPPVGHQIGTVRDRDRLHDTLFGH